MERQTDRQTCSDEILQAANRLAYIIKTNTTIVFVFLTHLLLTDSDQQSRFQRFTRGLYSFQKFLFTVCANQLSIGQFQFYFMFIYT